MRSRILLIFLLSLAISARAVPVRSQSLADVAKREEERRKAVKDNGKVYTNKDLKEAPPANPAASAPEPGKDEKTPADAAKGDGSKADAAKTAASDKGQEKDKAVPKDQTYWAGRMKDLQTALERDQVYADALQTRINALTTDFVNHDDPAQRSVIAVDREKAIGELARLKQQIVDDQKAISDLQEEARRAGAPPGWLR